MDKKLIKNTLLDAQTALEPFAEIPNSGMKDYICHIGICTMWECGRCSRAIHAYGALISINYALVELEKDNG